MLSREGAAEEGDPLAGGAGDGHVVSAGGAAPHLRHGARVRRRRARHHRVHKVKPDAANVCVHESTIYLQCMFGENVDCTLTALDPAQGEGAVGGGGVGAWVVGVLQDLFRG